MLLQILKSEISTPAGYVPSGGFTAATLDGSSYVVCDTDNIDWFSFRQGTQNGRDIYIFDYKQNGEIIPILTLQSNNAIANATGAPIPGITSYAPNIYIGLNYNLGHIMNISSNGGPSSSNSFFSYNQNGTGVGVSIIPSSWSIDVVQPLDGCSISLGPNPSSASSAQFTWETGSTTGLFSFVVNATSVDGLITNQLFVWNVYNQ
jgi:hypothetical protein